MLQTISLLCSQSLSVVAKIFSKFIFGGIIWLICFSQFPNSFGFSRIICLKPSTKPANRQIVVQTDNVQAHTYHCRFLLSIPKISDQDLSKCYTVRPEFISTFKLIKLSNRLVLLGLIHQLLCPEHVQPWKIGLCTSSDKHLPIWYNMRFAPFRHIGLDRQRAEAALKIGFKSGKLQLQPKLSTITTLSLENFNI